MATIAPRREEDAAKKRPVVNSSRLRRNTGDVEVDEKEVVVQEERKDSARRSDLKHPNLEELIQAAYNDDRNVRSIQAFYKSSDGKALPDEPRFSTDTLSTTASVAELRDTSRHDSQTLPDEPHFLIDDVPTSDHIAELPDTSKDSRIETGSIIELPDSSPSTTSSAETQFRWNDPNADSTTALSKAPQPKPTSTAPLKSILRKGPTRTNTSTSSDTISPPSSSSSSAAPLKSILKHTTVEQYSEAAFSEAGEDERSHHTVSENGSSRDGSVDSSGKWSSSDYDTSQLSEKELKKLEKKGINPALYLEMKAARGRKKFGGLGSLTGNAYVS